MIQHHPVYATQFGRRLSAPPPAPGELPPAPDVLYAGYQGAPGIVETILVLAVAGAASWVGIRTALEKGQDSTMQAAGWIGGVGSALLGLLYLGSKSGVGEAIGLPAVRVTPS